MHTIEQLHQEIAELREENQRLLAANRRLCPADPEEIDYDDNDDLDEPSPYDFQNHDSKGRPWLSAYNDAGEYRGEYRCI